MEMNSTVKTTLAIAGGILLASGVKGAVASTVAGIAALRMKKKFEKEMAKKAVPAPEKETK